LAERSRYEQSFRQCQNLWEDVADLRPLTFHPRIARAAAELLGADAVRVWHDQALYKEAGGRQTDAHQDQPYWPIAEPRTVTAWIPLDGADLASGCMAYVPGSHAVGLRRFVDIFGVRDPEPEDLLADPAISAIAPVFVEAPRGSVIFHHGLTAHLAGANTTDRPRRVHTVIYLADGCTRGRRFAHFAVDRPGIEVGAVIDSDLTPIAWPRPDGDLPPTPSC
jgi:ectoine hydroxylase-related dioxygenase (phytanoyl-CoA dioxygenase family)